MAIANSIRRLSETEYLASERHADGRSEFFGGEIYAMSGGSRWHSLIATNLAREFSSQLRGWPCVAYTSNLRVKVEASGLYTYPDLSVVCGEQRFLDDQGDTLLNPTMLVEVLSDSTEAYDRGRKFEHYRQIPSLREYLLVSQHEPRVEQFIRQSGGEWLLREVAGLKNRLSLASLEVTLALTEVFANVEFPANPASFGTPGGRLRPPDCAPMPRETIANRNARLRGIIAGLKSAYPDAHCELNFASPLQLLIATILSAQCSDKQVNLVTGELFQKYRSATDFANADPVQLESDIRRIGLYRNKAKNIRACCRKLVEQHHGEVPRSMPELVALDGVGRKTANVVLGNAFAISCGVVVDTHVARLTRRLGITRETSPEKIERALMQAVPARDWTLFSHLLIWHGRRRCFARGPDCKNCEIRSLCPRIGLPGVRDAG